ncbi:MAG: metallophosphoesterase, partial [Geminicoccaceae bacterium]|nr:metallophosphoesterase [Geminicoccaceae bacterium]
MRFIHTADWHIGRAFRFLSDATAPLLQAARVDAVTTIGRLAREHGVRQVLIAGDLYHGDGLAERTLRQPLERMHGCTALTWHVIPGNHDPARPRGLWDRVRRLGLPPNVRLHAEAVVAGIEPGVSLLPAPGGSLAGDPTAWMDRAVTPDGDLRIGLAHGPSRTFGSGARPGAVIDPGRVRSAGLDYLALGDWHGQREEGTACWYSGTPEPDRFDQPAAGHVLLVDVDRNAPARTTPLGAAGFRWA